MEYGEGNKIYPVRIIQALEALHCELKAEIEELRLRIEELEKKVKS